MSLGLRQDMRLTPRMIQSMEILQMPMMALEERIDQELQANPVLELKEVDPDDLPPPGGETDTQDYRDVERPMVVGEGSDGSADFDRLARMGEYLENEEWNNERPATFRPSSYEGERDRKLDAMANAPDRAGTLQDHLLRQWSFVEAPDSVKEAGRVIIDAIDAEGYLRTELSQLQQESTKPVTLQDLEQALKLVQTLEPSGVGARNLQECLLLQLDAIEEDEEMAEGHDFDLERALVRNHLDDLKMNRYPQISRKLDTPIDEIKAAVRRLARLHPHPGKQIGADEAPGITPDAIIYYDEETDRYEIKMTNDPGEDLTISQAYRKMLKDRSVDKKTREFLANNVRNARWLLESIQQRKSTIQRVIRVVVDAQRDFFDKGPEYLKPLPMVSVADQLGIHVATVSRAVSEKWIQTPRGIFPLRKFFSGGTTSAGGEDMSWDAVKEKLKILIENEDKQNPLNDDEIVDKLKEQGIDLARRTVAKYRKILNIPTARQRREY
jgi:RNA polymerase sigma-54 factor